MILLGSRLRIATLCKARTQGDGRRSPMRNIASGAVHLNMVEFAFIHRILSIVMDMVLTGAFGVARPKMMVIVPTVQQDAMRSDGTGALAS